MFGFEDLHSVSLRYGGKRAVILSLCWIIGITLGGAFGLINCSCFDSFVCPSAVYKSEPFHRFLIYAVSILGSFLTVILGCRILLYILSFFEGFVFSTILIGFLGYFPSCGWLYAALFLTPNVLFTVLLFLYWISCLNSTVSSAAKGLILIFAAIIPVLIIEFTWFKPIIIELLTR